MSVYEMPFIFSSTIMHRLIRNSVIIFVLDITSFAMKHLIRLKVTYANAMIFSCSPNRLFIKFAFVDTLGIEPKSYFRNRNLSCPTFLRSEDSLWLSFLVKDISYKYRGKILVPFLFSNCDEIWRVSTTKILQWHPGLIFLFCSA